MSTNAARGLVAVGSRTATPLQVVADALAAAGVVLPAGSALAGAAVAAATVPAVPGACRIGSRWNAEGFVEQNESVSVGTVITRITGDRVERHVSLRGIDGVLRESGTEIWRLDDPAAVLPTPELDFCSVEWGNLLSDSLEDDRGFTSSLSTWDGTIGLRCGDRELHLRIYKGTVVDVTRRVPHGATFTFVAPAHTWVDLVLSDTDDFMRRAISGEFSSSGDGYEYLRLTKPLNTIIAHARLIARKANS
ncbi:hypothetical protein EV641_1248 [Rhodococcus sp. SMB37]|uniref:hypothetical protein n=1 Tax=Rhodococcus sp. SMB37 TaxID=2512213 RepID=UPI0010448246|nr:hypothetical protein [Rhodococcus sp. SMB37]TCN45105.1 hypothetical protein EV641_1248 [Rhodococcus sp. SMB37]